MFGRGQHHGVSPSIRHAYGRECSPAGAAPQWRSTAKNPKQQQMRYDLPDEDDIRNADSPSPRATRGMHPIQAHAYSLTYSHTTHGDAGSARRTAGRASATQHPHHEQHSRHFRHHSPGQQHAGTVPPQQLPTRSTSYASDGGYSSPMLPSRAPSAPRDLTPLDFGEDAHTTAGFTPSQNRRHQRQQHRTAMSAYSSSSRSTSAQLHGVTPQVGTAPPVDENTPPRVRSPSGPLQQKPAGDGMKTRTGVLSPSSPNNWSRRPAGGPTSPCSPQSAARGRVCSVPFGLPRNAADNKQQQLSALAHAVDDTNWQSPGRPEPVGLGEDTTESDLISDSSSETSMECLQRVPLTEEGHTVVFLDHFLCLPQFDTRVHGSASPDSRSASRDPAGDVTPFRGAMGSGMRNRGRRNPRQSVLQFRENDGVTTIVNDISNDAGGFVFGSSARRGGMFDNSDNANLPQDVTDPFSVFQIDVGGRARPPIRDCSASPSRYAGIDINDYVGDDGIYYSGDVLFTPEQQQQFDDFPLSSVFCESAAQMGGKAGNASLKLLRNIFVFLDRDGDGQISRWDLRDVHAIINVDVTREQVADLYSRVDSEDSGLMNFKKFALGWKKGEFYKLGQVRLCIHQLLWGSWFAYMLRPDYLRRRQRFMKRRTASMYSHGYSDVSKVDAGVSNASFSSAATPGSKGSKKSKKGEHGGEDSTLLERIGAAFIGRHARQHEKQKAHFQRLVDHSQQRRASFVKTPTPTGGDLGPGGGGGDGGSVFSNPNVKNSAVVLDALSEQDRRELRRMRYRAIVVAGLYGLLSAVVSGVAELVANALWRGGATLPWESDFMHIDSEILLKYWLLVGIVTVVASLIEIVMVYRKALRTSFRMAEAVGLELHPPDPQRTFITNALSRCALEMGHPTSSIAGISVEDENLLACISAVIYKLKTSFSIVAARLILKRLLTRAASKFALPFAAVPLLMLWNVLIMQAVLYDATIVALGPACVVGICDRLLANFGRHRVTYVLRRELLRAVVCVMNRTHSVHPSVHLLTQHLVDTFGGVLDRDKQHIGSTALLRDSLAREDYLDHEEKEMVLSFMVLAVVCTGRFEKYETLVRRCFKAAGLHPGLSRVRLVANAFREGLAITDDHIRFCVENGGVRRNDRDQESIFIRAGRSLLSFIKL